ncbi:hypothetical protein [Mesorhizobium helmanticense]|uniref:Uncharacterized protein n=1 Tax=Mesorhizobium helmanticense TaxID=1776423 RepID=A0A2T4IWX2_9HYPH|nr:hypothetical protein [Mesorhizobium helmanticense]PTE10147.1 hypothetical protein C9427_11380 [Mesorhizobium helmanticense]
MDRVVITVHPTVSDEKLLSVTDAMQQVLDHMKLFEAAQQSMGDPHSRFEWRLEKASTNSPFTVVAVAQASNPSVNVSAMAKLVKTEVSQGLRSLMTRGTPPEWMTQDTFAVAKGIFARNLNGIGETYIDFEDGDVISITPDQAKAGINTLDAFNVMDFEQDLVPRQSFGEIEGVMLAAGRYRNREAIQIKNEMYGFIWCTLSRDIIERFGDEHSMSDIWKGKTLGVHGRLNYIAGGKLQTIDAVEVREIEFAPLVNLEAILDPDFTAGMDPHEYLEQLHEGRLG